MKLVRDWKDHGSFIRYTGFVAQAWSMVEYLSGVSAPEERRESFRGYLEGGCSGRETPKKRRSSVTSAAVTTPCLKAGGNGSSHVGSAFTSLPTPRPVPPSWKA